MAVVTVKKALIGKEDISYGNGTFSRATSTGGTQNITKLSTGVEVFNVKDYGAVGDGTTDDTTAIQAAIDAAEAAGGETVWLAGGTYLVNSTIVVRDRVSMVGAGVASVLTTASAITILSTEANANADGDYARRLADFVVDGNLVATTCLHMPVDAYREVVNVFLYDSAVANGVGLELVGTQNCTFLGCDIVRHYDCLKVLDGAGNNTFIRCRAGAAGNNHLYMNDDGTPDAQAFQSGPEANEFIGCLFEFDRSGETPNNVNIVKGRKNLFTGCGFPQGAVTTGAVVTLAADAHLNGFTHCSFVLGSTAIPAINHDGYHTNVLFCSIEGGSSGATAIASTKKMVAWGNHLANSMVITDNAASSTGAALFLDTLSGAGMRIPWLHFGSVAPAAGIAAGYVYYDSTANKLRMYNGAAWEYLGSAVQQTYTTTHSTDRTLVAASDTTEQVADVLGTLIADLVTAGVLKN